MIAQPRGDDFPISFCAKKAPSTGVLEFRVVEHHQRAAMQRQQSSPIVVITTSLFTARDAGNGWMIIKEAHTSAVLPLVIFDHQPKVRIEGVDGKQHPSSRSPGIP